MADQVKLLCGYRLMWIMVMFDLPVTTSKARKAYTVFRNHLLDCGFTMSQYSVYFKMVGSKEKAAAIEREIAKQVPENGHVQVIKITDKQYEKIQVFYGDVVSTHKKREQLQLF